MNLVKQSLYLCIGVLLALIGLPGSGKSTVTSGFFCDSRGVTCTDCSHFFFV